MYTSPNYGIILSKAKEIILKKYQCLPIKYIDVSHNKLIIIASDFYKDYEFIVFLNEQGNDIEELYMI